MFAREIREKARKNLNLKKYFVFFRVFRGQKNQKFSGF